VRVRDREPAFEPEPFTEDIPLAGFYLLDTDDRERALEIAARIPAARLGGAVEVRPLVGESSRRRAYRPVTQRSVPTELGV
jgi:hypothetical protein